MLNINRRIQVVLLLTIASGVAFCEVLRASPPQKMSPSVKLGWESRSMDFSRKNSGTLLLSHQSYIAKGIKKENSPIHSATRVKVPWARSGKYVAKFTARPPAFRCEFALMGGKYQFNNGTECFFGASYRPDDSWAKPTKYSIIITQWKLFGTPPMAALRLGNAGKRNLSFHIKRDLVNGTKDEKFVWDLGQMPANKWTDIVVFFKWSVDNDGEIKVWKNKELLLEYKGKTMTRDANGYTKYGMYTEIREPRTLYLDNVRIGKTYKEADPSK